MKPKPKLEVNLTVKLSVPVTLTYYGDEGARRGGGRITTRLLYRDALEHVLYAFNSRDDDANTITSYVEAVNLTKYGS